MKQAMVWFDHSEKRDLITKIRRASEYYYNRHGEYPTECQMHPDVIGDDPIAIPGMVVTSNPLVFRNHFAVGLADPESDTAEQAVS